MLDKYIWSRKATILLSLMATFWVEDALTQIIVNQLSD